MSHKFVEAALYGYGQALLYMHSEVQIKRPKFTALANYS